MHQSGGCLFLSQPIDSCITCISVVCLSSRHPTSPQLSSTCTSSLNYYAIVISVALPSQNLWQEREEMVTNSKMSLFVANPPSPAVKIRVSGTTRRLIWWQVVNNRSHTFIERREVERWMLRTVHRQGSTSGPSCTFVTNSWLPTMTHGYLGEVGDIMTA